MGELVGRRGQIFQKESGSQRFKNISLIPTIF